PYNTVTLLTHGFQFGLAFDDAPFEPEGGNFNEIAKLIVEASGGGVVLRYDKTTGDWIDPSSRKRNAEALVGNAGKAVVLIADWNKESDISDSGFAEAAADAMFASLVRLDTLSGNKIFASPLHFIGHSRGTVVNSEIIQRLGVHFKDAGGAHGIHMTTLDPHDMEQKTLNIPLNILIPAVYGGIAAVASIIAPPVGAALTRIGTKLPTLLAIADKLGIELDPAPFGDFKDPDAQVWDNVD